MKTLFHCYDFPPMEGGVGAYMSHMARALRANGHAAAVVTGRVQGLPETEETEAGTVYRAYDRAEIGSARVRDLVLDIARAEKADVIEGADHLGECATLLPAKDRPPVLTKLHACQVLNVLRDSHVFHPWQHLTIRAALWRAREQLRRERACIEQADLTLVSSNRLLREIRQQGLNLPKRWGVLPNPITPVSGFASAEAPNPTVLFVGRAEIGKGIEYLRGMLADIIRVFPDAMLEMIGADTYARGIGSLREWLVRRMGPLMKRVRLLGKVDGAGLNAAYARAWVVVLPSRWDNFPVVVQEAMIRGKAVVASPHGGMPEMLEGTECRIADPAGGGFSESVIAVLKDPSLRARAGESARRRALTEYSPERVVSQYITFLEKNL